MIACAQYARFDSHSVCVFVLKARLMVPEKVLLLFQERIITPVFLIKGYPT